MEREFRKGCARVRFAPLYVDAQAHIKWITKTTPFIHIQFSAVCVCALALVHRIASYTFATRARIRKMLFCILSRQMCVCVCVCFEEKCFKVAKIS